MLKSVSVDLVLLDLIMPQMDGFEVLHQMKLDESFKNIPVIVTSGEIDQKTIIRCIEMGAVDYLIKPFDHVLLHARIKNVLLAASYLETEPEDAPGKFLVVDDDPIFRLLLATNLEEHFHQVQQAENGIVALEMIKKEPFDLIFLDLLMPEMDGFKFLETLKESKMLVSYPVIVISADSEMESIVRCIEMGAVDYLNKPYESAILRARMIASLCAKRMHDKEKAYLKAIQSSQVAVSIENMQLHKSIHLQQEQYDTLIDNIPVGVFRISLQTIRGKFLKVNPVLVKMFGYEYEEELMKRIPLNLTISKAERKNLIDIVFQKGICKNLEMQLKKKDATGFIGSCSMKAKYDENGILLWIDGVIEDITEKKKLADRISILKDQKAKAEEQARLNLEKLNLDLEQKVEERTKELNNTLYAIKQDLNFAKKIQTKILPSGREVFGNLKITSRYIPMEEVGGDFFDIVELENKVIRVFIADASGHGVQAALITMLIKSEFESIKYSVDSPAVLLQMLNDFFYNKYSSLNSLFTCFLVDIDEQNETLCFASAGHPSQILISQKELQFLDRTGRILGAWKDTNITEVKTSFKKTDKLFLFTDGIFEEFNSKNEEFGEDNLFETIKSNQKEDVELLLDKVLERLNEFRCCTPICDDITLIGIEHF